MATTASGVTIPGASPTTTAATPIQDHWNNLGTSLNGRLVVPVASVTARASLVSALTAEGYVISASNPLYVHRADASPGAELEVTTDGATFRSLTTTSSSFLLYTPSGSIDTPALGTYTWLTVGNVTVPPWATIADVVYTINGVYNPATASNANVRMMIGAAAGAVNKRLLIPGTERGNVPIVDTFVGLAAGVQSVTLRATWNSGGVVRADGTSFVTAQFTWRP